MDLDALLITVTKLKAQVDEIRKRLGLDEPQETSLHGVQSEAHVETAVEPEDEEEVEEHDEEEVEEHDPETGHTRKTKKKKSR